MPGIKAPWMDAILVLLGTVMLTEFFIHLNLGTFTPTVFHQTLLDVLQQSNAPHWWKTILSHFDKNSLWLAPVSGAFLLLTSSCLILLIYRGIMGLIAAIFFLGLWLSYLAYPGIWIFEFLFPALIALVATLSSLRFRFLGPQFFGKLSWLYRILITAIAAIILYYCTILSKNANELTAIASVEIAITFTVLMLISAGIDRYRIAENKVLPSVLSKTIATNLMILLIAAMLIMQVFSNHAVDFFSVKGFQSLSLYYAKQTSAPVWFKDFLLFSSKNAAILTPLYTVFEICIAILLTLLILRGPALLCSFLLFAALSLSEFGVAATWPPRPNDPKTWLWELLFITIVTGFLAIQETTAFIQAKGLKQKLLNGSLYGKLPIFLQIVIAISAGILLWLAGYLHHVFGSQYQTIALQSGITFSILLLLLIFVDRKRSH